MTKPLLILARKLKKSEHAALPDSDFCIVKDVNGKTVRKYPVPDVENALDAITRTIQPGNDADKAAVHKFVFKKYPFLKKSYAAQNLHVLSNVINNYAESNKLEFVPSKGFVTITANDAFKFKLHHKALYLSEAGFRNIIKKFTKHLSKNPAKVDIDHKSPTMQAHHLSQMHQHGKDWYHHYKLQQDHTAEAKKATNPEDAALHTVKAQSHKKAAEFHSDQMQSHRQHLPEDQKY